MTEKKLTLEERYHRHVAKQPYSFPWQGRDWVLPHMAGLDYRLQNQIAKFDTLDMDELEQLFDRMLGKEQAAEWAQVDVPGDYLTMVFTDWLEHSGEQAGEDSASNDSLKTTGTSSRQTSRASTTTGSSKSSSAKKATPRKRAPRKATTVKPAGVLTPGDQEWIAGHEALASGSS